MAKGLTLVETNITGFQLDGLSGRVWLTGEIRDDNGDVIMTQTMEFNFDALDPPVRAQLNSVMRSMSRTFNNDKVNENSETWVDK